MATLKIIPGFPNYKAGDDGSIWSNRRGRWTRMKGHAYNKHGHTRVLLERKHNFQVHRLILLTFVGPCPDGMECCHNDGNAANNRRENLRWDTYKANAKDRIAHGTHPAGEKNPAAKITAEIVLQIRDEYSKGELGYKRLGLKYGL